MRRQAPPVELTQTVTVTYAPGLIRYVRQGGLGNGTSWTDASGDLQSQINATGVQQVWVAAGTYKPTTTTGPDSRTISFSMKDGVAILGGFPSSGNPGLADRNPASFTTTLSGDIGTPGATIPIIATTSSSIITMA